MINVLLAFDTANPRGGSFMSECLIDIQNYFSGKKHSLTLIESSDMTSQYIHDRTVNLPSFIFVPYCHGNHVCLANNIPEAFISTTINITNFSNSFFYTFSCKSGHTLGNELINNGCQCFFGYKNTIYSFAGFKCFSDCANYGLFLFVNGMSSDDVYNDMITFYNNQIDQLYIINPVVASHLRANRDALVKIGNNINIDELINLSVPLL